MTFWDFSRILTAKRRNLFQDINFSKSYLLPIRGYSWHKNEIKMIKRGHFSSNNFQDSTRFSQQREFIGGRVMSGGGPGAHTTWWHGQGVARTTLTLWCGRLLVWLRLSPGLRLPFR
jgi:hypothetical protein